MGTESENDPDTELIRGLQNPAAFPHAVSDLRLIETHISWVILTGDFAYKIKKPVSLGFLNFSTLERRKHFCEEEVRLNRRTAPELYLDVVPIGDTGDGPKIGLEPAIEYAVLMRQFPEDALLDRCVEAALVSPQDIKALAREISRFHQALPSRENIDPKLAAARAIKLAQNNFKHLHPELLSADSRRELAAIEMWTLQKAKTLGPVFEARAGKGFIRECHGDLHLANLVVLENRIVPFDCILIVSSSILSCAGSIRSATLRSWSWT
jgi:aminoglycoside phosphotransferase family enzyme